MKTNPSSKSEIEKLAELLRRHFPAGNTLVLERGTASVRHKAALEGLNNRIHQSLATQTTTNHEGAAQ